MKLSKVVVGITILILCLTLNRAQSSHDGSRMAMLSNYLIKNVWHTDGAPFFNTVDMVFDNGHFYSDKPPIFVIYSAILLKPVSWVINFRTGEGIQLLYYLATITSSGFSCLALIYLMCFTLNIMECKKRNMGLIILSCLFGNAFFPYSLMYITHMTEALFLLFAFYFLLKTSVMHSRLIYPISMGIVSGLNATVHPFVAGLFAIFTTAHLLLKKWVRPCIAFCIATALLAGLGILLNYKMFGHVKPYYMMPDKYIYAFQVQGKTYYSGFLSNPTVQGLSEQQMLDQMNKYKIHPLRKAEFLKRLRNYKDFSKNQFRFAISNWMRWDYLYFNPLMVFTMSILIKNIFSKETHYRSEKILVILTILGAYYSSIFQRSMAGNCIGNRYLVPLMPMLFVAASKEITSNKSYLLIFKTLTLVCVAILLPGIIRPMNEPDETYAVWIAIFFALSSIFCCASVFNKRIELLSGKFLNLLSKNSLCVIFLFIGLSLTALKLYTFSYGEQVGSIFFYRTIAVYVLTTAILFWISRETCQQPEKHIIKKD